MKYQYVEFTEDTNLIDDNVLYNRRQKDLQFPWKEKEPFVSERPVHRRLRLGVPYVTKSAVFLNIAQNAVLNIAEQIFLMDFLKSA